MFIHLPFPNLLVYIIFNATLNKTITRAIKGNAIEKKTLLRPQSTGGARTRPHSP